MARSGEQQIIFSAPRQAELVPVAPEDSPPGPREVRGKTIASLISAGTELACYQGLHGMGFPSTPGYAAVFRVEAAGGEVSVLIPGDLAFCMGGHRSHQRCDVGEILKVPQGLPAEHAVFARLMGVGMSTLTTTKARPPDLVAVLGLGPVGFLAAQVFRCSGYRVLAVDPRRDRRELATRHGLTARGAAPLEDPRVAGQVALVLECAGHEQAALDGCRLVAKGGEVVLVGVPWAQHTSLSAHELLDTIFHRYAVVRSGWEWEVPRHAQDFRTGSIFGNIAGAMEWLAEGRIDVSALYETASPRDAQQVYQRLLAGDTERLATVFDWAQLH